MLIFVRTSVRPALTSLELSIFIFLPQVILRSPLGLSELTSSVRRSGSLKYFVLLSLNLNTVF